MRFILLMCLALTWFGFPLYAIPSLSAPQQAEQGIEQPQSTPAFLQPLKRQFVKWTVLINKEVPKRMKALKDNPSPWIILSSMLAALTYGILHTLGPGHGKMVVASYFLTHGAHFWRGVFVGAQVAFSHVAGAVFVVFVTDIAMRQLLTDPDAQMFWMRAFSYSLIMLIGLFMLVQAIRHALGVGSGASCGHCSHGHHHHNHSKREALLAWCVGAVPCTGSLLILLYAMAHNILWLGLAMVAFIGFGMALAMTVIGWLCILGKKKVIDRYLPSTSHGHTWQIGLEIFGALAIMGLGGLLLLAVLY